MEFVKTERRGRIAEVTIDRGDGRNALSIQTLEELRDTARALNDDPDLVAVILAANGAFSAGADLKDTGASVMATGSVMEKRQFLRLGPDCCQAWEDIEAYTIAAMEDYCIGGASAVTAAMDYRIIGKSAHLRLPEIAPGYQYELANHPAPCCADWSGPHQAICDAL